MSQFTFLRENEGEKPDLSFMRFGVVVTEWNAHIVDAMLQHSSTDVRSWHNAVTSMP